MHLRRSILATKVGCAAFTRKAYSQFNTQREAYYCIRQLPDNFHWICMQRHYYIVCETKYNSETTNSNCQTMIFGAIWKKKMFPSVVHFLLFNCFFFTVRRIWIASISILVICDSRVRLQRFLIAMLKVHIIFIQRRLSCHHLFGFWNRSVMWLRSQNKHQPFNYFVYMSSTNLFLLYMCCMVCSLVVPSS